MVHSGYSITTNKECCTLSLSHGTRRLNLTNGTDQPECVSPLLPPRHVLEVPVVGLGAVFQTQGLQVGPRWPEDGQPVHSHFTPLETDTPKEVRCEQLAAANKLYTKTWNWKWFMKRYSWIRQRQVAGLNKEGFRLRADRGKLPTKRGLLTSQQRKYCCK